jgi:hypothetical protein
MMKTEYVNRAKTPMAANTMKTCDVRCVMCDVGCAGVGCAGVGVRGMMT